MTQFEQVYQAYFKDVYKYAFSLTRDESLAEEITQETFFKALKSIDKFDGKCKVYVWLCQIAKNTYFSLLRREKAAGKHPQAVITDDSLEQRFLTQESAFEIHRVLHDLPEPYKEVFSLRTFGELSFRQIGELFGHTESWARVMFHRAKIKIKEALQ